jgi:Na+-transporting NADH:ubiquinone oxidoreductase subunit C
MSQNIKTIIFVLIMGLITSLTLLGVEALTADRIQNNQDAEIKAAILDAYGITYTAADINTIFDDSVEIVVIGEWTFYVDEVSGNISYAFLGNGVWGPIEGIITLQSDFETIVKIAVLQQEETPGLGGVVAEPQYLATFIGKKMVPSLEINKDPALNLINEVDAIVGATNTSKRFETLLNANYANAKSAWLSQNE